VLASAVGGLRGLIRDNDTGWLFAPEAADAVENLAAKLMRLADEPATRTRLAEAGRREAISHYDWPEINRQLEELYHAAEAHAARRYGRART